MAITVTCNECGTCMRLRDEAVGKRFRCKSCGNVFSLGSRNERNDHDDNNGVNEKNFQPQRRRRSVSQTRKPRSKRRNSRSDSQMPQKVKEAVLGLATAGLLWSVFSGMGLYLSATGDLDAVGRGITYYLLSLGIGGFIGSALLWSRVPGSKFFAMFISVFYLIFFPLGTIVGVIIFRGLLSTEMAHYLAARS